MNENMTHKADVSWARPFLRNLGLWVALVALPLLLIPDPFIGPVLGVRYLHARLKRKEPVPGTIPQILGSAVVLFLWATIQESMYEGPKGGVHGLVALHLFGCHVAIIVAAEWLRRWRATRRTQ